MRSWLHRAWIIGFVACVSIAVMYRVRQQDLPFKGSSRHFVGAAHGDVGVSVFLVNAPPGQWPNRDAGASHGEGQIQPLSGTWAVQPRSRNIWNGRAGVEDVEASLHIADDDAL